MGKCKNFILNAKQILEIRAVIFDYQNEDEYEYHLRKLYENKTNNEYHVIVLFTQIEQIKIEERNDYPILKVL